MRFIICSVFISTYNLPSNSLHEMLSPKRTVFIFKFQSRETWSRLTLSNNSALAEPASSSKFQSCKHKETRAKNLRANFQAMFKKDDVFFFGWCMTSATTIFLPQEIKFKQAAWVTMVFLFPDSSVLHFGLSYVMGLAFVTIHFIFY